MHTAIVHQYCTLYSVEKHISYYIDRKPSQSHSSKMSCKINNGLYLNLNLLTLCLYITDIITDIATGLHLIYGTSNGSSHFNFTYDEESCEEWSTKPHPVWGGLTIGIIFLPGLVMAIPAMLQVETKFLRGTN